MQNNVTLDTAEELLRELPLTDIEFGVYPSERRPFKAFEVPPWLKSATFDLTTNCERNPDHVKVPGLPEVTRLRIEYGDAVPVITWAPALTHLELICSVYHNDPPNVCLFKHRIGARLQSLHLHLEAGLTWWMRAGLWSTLTDGCMSMPVLEYLATDLLPPKDLQLPRLKMAHITTCGVKEDEVGHWRSGIQMVPRCCPEWSIDLDAARMKLRYPLAACFVFCQVECCNQCHEHKRRYNGLCECGKLCTCLP
jgi:hypothetical protein